jgi:colicin import membrane protein
MQGMAGGTGSPNSSGTAAQSAGPSAGYAGRIKARIKPNITLTETLTGNPLAEVEVRTAPDGLILSRRLLKKSGDEAWDAAVLRAIDKTERLPRDEDGRVPPVFVISFRPND